MNRELRMLMYYEVQINGEFIAEADTFREAELVLQDPTTPFGIACVVQHAKAGNVARREKLAFVRKHHPGAPNVWLIQILGPSGA